VARTRDRLRHALDRAVGADVRFNRLDLMFSLRSAPVVQARQWC
jgi:hypothetical protein